MTRELHSRWDELTANEWAKALQESKQTAFCLSASLKSTVPRVPIGSGLIPVREWTARATKMEYAVVFPDYFYRQINETRHQYGTFALPERVIWDLLEVTCDGIGRNGFNKIVIINGHRVNPEPIGYFIQTRLEKQRIYSVYFFEPPVDSAHLKKMNGFHKSDKAVDQLAG